MSEIYQVTNQRRIFCGRCRMETNQVRMTGEIFDSPGVLTYQCQECSALYGVCKVCGTYLRDGKTCSVSHEALGLQVPASQENLMSDIRFPDNIDESRLVPDPHGRPGHWLHPGPGGSNTDTVLALGPDYRPPTKKASTSAQATSSVTEKDDEIDLTTMSRPELVKLAKELGVPAVGKNPELIAAIRAASDAANAAEDETEEDDDISGRRVKITVGRYEGTHGAISEVGDEDENFAVRVIADGTGKEIPLQPNTYEFLTPEEIAADEAALLQK